MKLPTGSSFRKTPERLKLAVFDLDGTLAPIGRGISERNVSCLKQLEQAGLRIAICSGKSEFYLCGLLRQIELKKPIIVAENGAVIRFGIDLPPERYTELPYPISARDSLNHLKKEIAAALPEIYFQPNNAGLTPFPRSEFEFEFIERIIERERAQLSDVTVYRHADSFDIVPNGISKYEGLKKLSEMCGIPSENTVAVGDGVNDYPMFDFAGFSIGIKTPPERSDITVESIDAALDLIKEMVNI